MHSNACFIVITIADKTLAWLKKKREREGEKERESTPPLNKAVILTLFLVVVVQGVRGNKVFHFSTP